MKYKRFYIDKENLLSGKLLTGEEFHHAINVLRIKQQDTICLFCNDDNDYIADVSLITNHGLSYNIIKKTKNGCNPTINITLIQALAKSDKLELISQKATELGVSTIIPFYSRYTDVKPTTTKTDRLNKIVLSACKQCGRSKIPTISPITKLSNINFDSYDLVLFANETEKSLRLNKSIKNKSIQNIAIIIGPEGGFSEDEIQFLNKPNIKSVSLGKRILRTETAGLYILSYLNETLTV